MTHRVQFFLVINRFLVAFQVNLFHFSGGRKYQIVNLFVNGVVLFCSNRRNEALVFCVGLPVPELLLLLR